MIIVYTGDNECDIFSLLTVHESIWSQSQCQVKKINILKYTKTCNFASCVTPKLCFSCCTDVVQMSECFGAFLL